KKHKLERGLGVRTDCEISPLQRSDSINYVRRAIAFILVIQSVTFYNFVKAEILISSKTAFAETPIAASIIS
uniref:Uncharacterized protein n=1 Tax=Romanomermis culicivorax TaxID=13658 RepID=A0A915L9K1_ROMCU